MQRRLISIAFLCALFGLPVAQAVLELVRGEPVLILDLPRAFRDGRRPAFEEDLRKASFVRRAWVPRYQELMSRVFGRGNEKAIEGRAGAFFYADDLDLLAGPGLMQASETGPRAVAVIAAFKEALAERGIELLVVPVPIKGNVDAGWLAVPRPAGLPDLARVPRNPDEEAFFAALDERGVASVRLLPLFLELARERAAAGREETLYLLRDTHWRPDVMQRAARAVAERARELLGEAAPAVTPFATEAQDVVGTGDLVRMLRLPGSEAKAASSVEASVFPALEVVVDVVRGPDGALLEADPTSDVLLLGDSFTRIFSDPELGFGAGAGFAEHLALELGRPLDVIAQLGGSSSGVRESLARRPGGLDGKRLVIWEFGLRALGEGAAAWRDAALPPPGAAAGATPEEPDAQAAPQDPGLSEAEPLVVEARLVAASRMRPEFDYPFCLVIHEYAVERVVSGALDAATVWVAFDGMVDYEVRAPARWETGRRQRLTLEDLSRHHPLEETAFVDDGPAPVDQPLWYALEHVALD